VFVSVCVCVYFIIQQGLSISILKPSKVETNGFLQFSGLSNGTASLCYVSQYSLCWVICMYIPEYICFLLSPFSLSLCPSISLFII
jgi:hypothetical protein